MKYKRFCLILIFFLAFVFRSNIYAFSFTNWLWHWNISFLYPVLGSPYVQNESLSTYFTVYDAYGDDYTFYVNQNSTNGSLKQIPINIRIPLLYSDDFSIGFGNIQRYFESNIFSSLKTKVAYTTKLITRGKCYPANDANKRGEYFFHMYVL